MVTYSCKAVHSNITIDQTPLVIHPFTILVSILPFNPYLLHFKHCAKTIDRNHLQEAIIFLYNRNYRHFFDVVSKSSSSSFYLILTVFGTSTALCLVVELLSPASPVLLTTLGLDVPFLVDCGLVPFF